MFTVIPAMPYTADAENSGAQVQLALNTLSEDDWYVDENDLAEMCNEEIDWFDIPLDMPNLGIKIVGKIGHNNLVIEKEL